MSPIKIEDSPRYVTKLCVPGSSEKMITKAFGLSADQIILDLEDSVLEEDKTLARKNIAAIAKLDRIPKSIRTNSLHTRHFEDDVAFLKEHAYGFDQIVLPKIDSREMLDECICELSPNIALEVQIETTSGLVNIAEIASHPRVTALSFGPLDFLASVGVPIVSSKLWGEEIHGLLRHAFMQIIIAGHANQKYVYDGPTVVLEEQTLITSTTIARNLGADGKWLIHPDQIKLCAAIFNEKFILDIETSGMQSGSAQLSGQMVDMASLRIAKNKEN